MSGYRTHLGGAAIAFLVVLLLAGLWWQLTVREVLVCLGIVLLAGLWPDVDTRSKGQGLFYSLFFLFDLWLISQAYYRAAAFWGLLILLPILGKHRGFTHSRWAAIVIPGALYGLYVYYRGEFNARTLVYLLAALGGYFSHLALDRKL